MDAAGIAWHEKTLGQLFCDGSAKEVIAMLTREMADADVRLVLGSQIKTVGKDAGRFRVVTSTGTYEAPSLVIATGGKSIPKMGATGYAYDIARQFDVPLTKTRAALVPYTFSDKRFSALSGVSLPTTVTTGGTAFDEALLFTHRGLSGPAILQSSSYWSEGDSVHVNLLPGRDILSWLSTQKQIAGRGQVSTLLSTELPGRLVENLSADLGLTRRRADLNNAQMQEIAERLQNWCLTPQGTEGYRTAEVTLGGVRTDALNARTLEAKSVPGLYFIGECVDVTGWLGGYNFQWAWSSAMAAARHVNAT
jgi:predicted Rossmann fold flavoprotein